MISGRKLSQKINVSMKIVYTEKYLFNEITLNLTI